MAKGTCSIDGCGRRQYARGLCNSHDRRAQLYGDPLAGPPVRPYLSVGPGATLEDRFWSKVDTTDPFGCWVWQAATERSGYGRFQIDGRPGYAHRVAYELSVGPIPAELEIDHLCRNRRCVNPLHLEPVTPSENQRRRPDRMVTHCPQGHPYSGDNLRVYGTRRYCVTCNRERSYAHYLARRNVA